MRKILIVYFLLFLASPAFAEQLGTLSTDNLEFSLSQDGSDFKLYIKPLKDLGEQSLTANVFPVKSPSRLVIDIPDLSKGAKKSIEINNEFISGMRLGIHDNKTRLVIDINDEGVPAYDIVADEENLRLVATFSISSSKKEKIVEKEKLEVEKEVEDEFNLAPIPRPTPKPIIIPPPKVIVEPTPKTSTTPKQVIKDFQESGSISIKPTPAEKTETFVMIGNKEVKDPITKETPVKSTMTNPASTGKQTLIKNILFQAPKDSPLGAIVIEGDNIGEYQLDQKGKNLYELTLPNSKLSGEHLSLPQFPPASFKGFEVILANQNGSDVLLKIYVNQGVKIKSHNAKGKLWLKAEN